MEIEFEKDICGDPRIQPGSLVSLSNMSKDVFRGRVAGNLSHPEIFGFQDVIKNKNKTTIFS